VAHTLHYAGGQWDRADRIRRDTDELQRLWQSPDTRWLPVFKANNLIAGNAAVMRTRAELEQTGLSHDGGTFLGLDNKGALFSVECDEQQAHAWRKLQVGSEFVDLRAVGSSMSTDEACLLGYARALSHWQTQNRYCGVCGGLNTLTAGGHVTQCSNVDCQRQVFPRTDPAVIMLVERIDAQGQRSCLLGRTASWPEGVYSTLAGFVEPGESLEDAVVREVAEEAGIAVRDVRYCASQPWPFPQSIMLGFVATAVDDDIVIDTHELEDARWFSESELPLFGDWGDQAPGFKLPRTDSIARFLIDSWLADAKG